MIVAKPLTAQSARVADMRIVPGDGYFAANPAVANWVGSPH